MHHRSHRLAGHLARALLLVAASLIAACGGGGGGGPALSITLSPASVSASFYRGSSYNFSETATVQGEVSGNVFVVLVDHAGVLQPNVGLQSEGPGRYIAALATASTLATGHYTGAIQINLCDSLGCTHQYGSTSLPYDFTVLPGPSITTLNPASANAGGSAFTLTIDGANFNNASQVIWNGNTRPTGFVSSTRLTAQISNADILTGGTYNVSVANGASGGSSDPVGFTVLNLKPALASLSPNTLAPGTVNAFIVTATGTNFVSTSVLQWNGSPRPTTYISPTQVSAQIEAADVASGGNANVTVVNPAPGGGTSGVVVFSIKNPVPTLGALNNGSAAAGCGAFNLYLVGNNFAPQSVVMWNGSPRPTTSLGSTFVLSAQISAADIASAGTASVTVFNPAPAGGTSAAVTFTTSASTTPTTDAVALQLNAAHTGYATTTCPVSPAATSSWSFTFPDGPLYPLIAGNKVFATTVGFNGPSLYALDQKTGKTDWGPVAASGTGTAYDAGSLFVVGDGICCSAGLMQAFNAADGTQKWLANLVGQFSFTSGATPFDGRVYTAGAGDSGTLYAVDESNGNTVWTANVINGDSSTPAVTVDGVYTDYPCHVSANKPGDGSVVWQEIQGCDGGGGATTTVANGILYAPYTPGNSGGTTFNALTGAQLGTYSSDNYPAITPHYGFFVVGGILQAYKLPGDTLAWSFGSPGGITTSPIAVNQTVFVATQPGKLFALDAASGQMLWSYDFGTPLNPGGSLAAGDNLLVVPIGNAFTAFTIASPLAPR